MFIEKLIKTIIFVRGTYLNKLNGNQDENNYRIFRYGHYVGY